MGRRCIGAEGFMNRREILRAGVAKGVLQLAHRPLMARDQVPRVMTVVGPIAPEQMGATLPHEHILVDFIGAAEVSRARYDADEVSRVALPQLRRIREQGVRTLVECTPDYLGRDPALLRRLAKASGLQILTNTGYYGANGGKHLPEHAFTESAE
jgi:phosphotriesterase-related protein